MAMLIFRAWATCGACYHPIITACFTLFTAISRNVVGKSARDNPETSLLFKETWKNGTRGHGRMFATAKGKQQW